MADVTREIYAPLPDGRQVELYTLSNRHGLRVRILTYGALTTSVEVPDAAGRVADVTLGYDDLAGWLDNPAYFGATIGRCANRIARGRFTLDGQAHSLATNAGADHLHGGVRGFSRALWSAEPTSAAHDAGVRLHYTSPDGEEHSPGRVAVVAWHRLTDDNEFRIDFTATTDRPTLVNLTHHSYWNLAGPQASDIRGHELLLCAKSYTPTDAQLIPTGEIRPVAGTPLDFTAAQSLGARLDALPTGYDHNFVLEGAAGTVRLAARLRDPHTGRTLELHTDQPGVQFYTSNFLDGSIIGKRATAYQRHAAVCLEPQGFPDAANHANFPSVVLRPGAIYRHTMIHKFSA
jgi:aldose 1-epimerase